jgi:prepilin-type N-terminal cleavage/methylation domain-containing protein/prepilin-type processing-associated H-X9-DG protein
VSGKRRDAFVNHAPSIHSEAILRKGDFMTGDKRNHGFTLIELLCVIAILGSLASMLFPVFARAREKARATYCIGNLRQMGIAMQLYVNEWDGRYPFAFSPRFKNRVVQGVAEDKFGVVSSHPVYTELLLPYLTSRSALHCPSDSGTTGEGMDETDPYYTTDAFATWGTSYDYGADVPEKLSGRPPFGGSSPREPIITPIFNDAAHAWHNGYCQVIFADGHAGRELPMDLIDMNAQAYLVPQE